MANLSTKPNRAYPSIPAVTGEVATHTNALQQMRESIETHERRNSNYPKSFIRFEELVALGIIDVNGENLLSFSTDGGSATALDDLSDVAITTPADNNFLGFDVGSGLWVNQTASQMGVTEIGHTHVPGDIIGLVSPSVINDLNDVNTAGSTPYDMLYKDLATGDWVDTNSFLQFDGTDLHLKAGDINFYAVGATVEQSIRQNFPAGGDLTIDVPGGGLVLQPQQDVFLSPGNNVRVIDANVFMDNAKAIFWKDSDAVPVELLVLDTSPAFPGSWGDIDAFTFNLLGVLDTFSMRNAFYNDDGTRIFYNDGDGASGLYKTGILSPPWVPVTAVPTLVIATGVSQVFGHALVGGGTRYYTGTDAAVFDVRTNSGTPGDPGIGDIGSIDSTHTGTQNSSLGFHVKEDGTKLWYCPNNTAGVHEINIATPHDLSTATAGNSYNPAEGGTGVVTKVNISPAGTEMWLTIAYITMYQYTLSVPFDITSATYTGNSLDATINRPAGSGFTDFDVSPDGTHFIMQFARGNVASLNQTGHYTSAGGVAVSPASNEFVIGDPAYRTQIDGLSIDLTADTNVTGNINVTGTVDGRDVAADGTAQDSHIADATIHFADATADSQNYVRFNNTWAVAPTYAFGEYVGTFDASSGNFPAAVNQGDWYNTTVAGTVDSQPFIVGDTLIALVDVPSTTTFAANWSIVPNVGVYDHTGLTSIGTNTHAQIDSHISDATIHFTENPNWNTAFSWGNHAGLYSLLAHTHLLAAGATDVTATFGELNLLDLAGLTAGWVLSADSATTASWKAPSGGGSGTVTSSGTPLSNEVAVFTSGTDIDSDSTFTWDGTTMFATNVTGTNIGGIAQANLLDKSATESIAGTWTFTGGSGQPRMESIAPGPRWIETGGPVNETNWWMVADGGGISLRAYDDILSTYDNVFAVTRTGINVDEVQFSTDATQRLVIQTAGISVTGDVAGTTIGGITEANLLDKTAAEYITANWIIDVETSGPHLEVRGGSGGASIARFRRDVGSDAFVDINASGGEPQIVFDRTSGTNQWAIGCDQANQFVIADSGAINTNDLLILTSAGDLSATSFGGITEANLLDKTAAESVTGVWDFTSSGATLDVNARVINTNDAGGAELQVRGNGQGDGYIFVGQSDTFGGGVAYRGDATSPKAMTGAGTDRVTYFARNAGVDTEVFSHSYIDDDVRFLGTIAVTGTVTGSNLSGTNTGDNAGVTSVGGTGTINGLTLSGTVTTTGNLTLGGSLSGSGAALTALTAANISGGNLGSGVLPYVLVDGNALNYKIPYINHTGTTSGNYALFQETTATFTYNPSTNVLVAGTFSGSGAALTGILESAITDSTILARLASNEVVTGQWSVPSTIQDKTASYTLIIGDAGQTIRFTGATASKVCTIPANASVAYPIGTLIGITNDGSVSMTLAITTDTMTWGKDNTTGTRTLAAGADCVIHKTTATTWKINGSALVT